jgi:histidinol-phosphate phosphatase family protein
MAPAGAPSDLTKQALTAMVQAGRRLYAYVSPEYIKDVGTPQRLDEVERDVAAGVPERLSTRALRSALFLDRDGTLNRDSEHLNAVEQVELLGGAGEAVRRINRAGRLAVVVTNQAAVARGDVTSETLARIHIRLKHQLAAAGAYLDAIYVCPHHPDSGFAGEVPELKIACDCRKPGTALIDAACRHFAIDRASSWMVGDTTSDIEAGRRAGLKTVLVRTGHAGQDGKHAFRPDYVVPDLPAAVSWILEGHTIMSRRAAPIVAAAINARMLVIGGLARSGKSFLAQVVKEIIQACGRTAHVLPLDSWLKPRTHRSEGSGVAARYDLERLVHTLRPIVGSGRPHRLEVPVYDRARRAMYEQSNEISIGPEDLIIVEGVPALVHDELMTLADVRVHVEMPEEARLSRLRADYRWRGESAALVDTLISSREVDESPAVKGAGARAHFTVATWTSS